MDFPPKPTKKRLSYTSYPLLPHLQRTHPNVRCIQGKPLDRPHIVTRCPKYNEARKMFNKPTSLRLERDKENTETIYKFYHTINLTKNNCE